MDRRRGVFNISRDMIKNNPKTVRQVMGQVIIFRAEHLFETDSIQYHAICDDFHEVPERGMSLNYVWEANEEEFKGWTLK